MSPTNIHLQSLTQYPVLWEKYKEQFSNHNHSNITGSTLIINVIRVASKGDGEDFTNWLRNLIVNNNFITALESWEIIDARLLSTLTDLLCEYPGDVPIEIWVLLVRFRSPIMILKSLWIRKGMSRESFEFFMGSEDIMYDKYNKFMFPFPGMSRQNSTTFSDFRDFIKSRKSLLRNRDWYSDAISEYKRRIILCKLHEV